MLASACTCSMPGCCCRCLAVAEPAAETVREAEPTAVSDMSESEDHLMEVVRCHLLIFVP